MADAEFELDAEGDRVRCRITTEKRREPPSHIRRVVLDDQCFDLDDVRDDAGTLVSRVRRKAEEWIVPNVLRETIRHFMEGEPLLDARAALENHQRCMGVLRRVLGA